MNSVLIFIFIFSTFVFGSESSNNAPFDTETGGTSRNHRSASVTFGESPVAITERQSEAGINAPPVVTAIPPITEVAAPSQPGDDSAALHVLLMAGRNKDITKWSTYLQSSQLWWYRSANLAEGLSQVCQVATPIIAACAAATDVSRDLALVASIIGGVGVGLGKFSRYAHKESAERGRAANKFLEAEGIRGVPIINDGDAASAV